MDNKPTGKRMKIQLKIAGENQQLVEKMTKLGIEAKLVRGGVIITLPQKEKESWDSPNSFSIPPELQGIDANYCIDIPEEGGGMSNTGSSQIVCGLSGKALWPYYVPRSGHLSNGTHAYFSVPSAVATVSVGDRRDNDLTILEHRIVREKDEATIVSKNLWQGQLENLPQLFERFRLAAAAAVAKANCYHCRETHYAAE
jgi:hypothetical protein